MRLPPACPRLSRLAGDELDAALLERARRYPLAASDDEIVARALAYPYVPPHRSYVLNGPVEREGRHVVLAYGANGAAEVLLRKLGEDARVEVVATTLHDFDVVYSSHVSAYGAIPSTLHPAPGAAVPVFELLVDDAQLVRLVETEFNYSVRGLGGTIAFVSRHGALGITGAPIPLHAMGQREVQALVRERVAPHESEAEFILGNVRDHARALRFTVALRREGIAFEAGDAVVLDV